MANNQDTTEICCICLQKCYFLENINQYDGKNNIKYIEKLQTCVPNEMWDEDINICSDCVESLDFAYNFLQTCLKSEEYRSERRTLKLLEDQDVLFECDMCGKSFKLKRTLKLHLTRIHTGNSVKKKAKATEGNFKNEENIKNVQEELDIKAEESQTFLLEPNHIPDNEDYFYDSNDIDGNCSLTEYEETKVSKEAKKRKTGRKVSKKLKNSLPRKKRDPFKCEYCGLIFNRRCRFLEHVRSKHTYEKPFKCDLCEAAYYSNAKLSVHKRKHRNEKPYICPICGKSFTSNNDLWMHNKTHGSERPYKCKECEKSFKTPNNLRVHKRQMHDKLEWKHVCTKCGKKFPINSTLEKHIRRHENIRLYACHLCDKRFVDKTNMQSHLSIHSNERLHKCNICTKEYKKKETLKKHLKRDHDIGTIELKKPEKNLLCPMCPKTFAYNTKLQRHLLTHTGEKPVKCEHCDKRFRDTYDKNVHCKKEHYLELEAAGNRNVFC